MYGRSARGTFKAKSDKVYVRIFLTSNYKNWYDNTTYGKDPCWTDIENVTLVDKNQETGIHNVIETDASNLSYYTLSGMRVAKPTKSGVYVHNGKKVIVR